MRLNARSLGKAVGQHAARQTMRIQSLTGRRKRPSIEESAALLTIKAVHQDCVCERALNSRCRYLAAVLLLTLASACSTAPIRVQEVYYLAVSDGKNTNYFRVKVDASTALGIAEFRSGWFPASAVDALFGDVSEEGSGKALMTREKMREQLDEAILKGQRDYLTALLSREGATPKEIDRLLEVQARIRQVPLDEAFPNPNTFTMEYDPGRGLAVARSDEKLVWVLSADPDEVVGNIANLVEQQETQKAILGFTNVIVDAQRGDVIARQATGAVAQKDDALIGVQISTALSSLETDPSRDNAVEESRALIALLRAVLQGIEP